MIKLYQGGSNRVAKTHPSGLLVLQPIGLQMAQKRYVVNPKKWPGVYGYDSTKQKVRGKADVCYYITYKVEEVFIDSSGTEKTRRKKIWEKVGWKFKEGYSPELAAELRASRLRTKRHGNQVKTSKEIQKEKQQQNRTIGELKTAYFNSERGLKLKGRKTDLNRYEKHLEKLFSKQRVDRLTVLDMERVKRAMKGHAPATISNALELVRRIVNYGVKHNLCSPLPFTIELPKKDNQVTEYLTPEQADRFMKVLKGWKNQDAPRMLQIAWLTGMRRGEIFKLEDRDCDFLQKIITLRNPKGSRTESVPMSEPVEELLKKQMESRDKVFQGSPFVFPGKYGKQRTDSSAVNRIKIKAKLPKEFRIFHGLRHHLAVTLASSGQFTLDMIGSLLTHKSYEMTKRYAKFLPDAKKRAADQAAELLKAHAKNEQQGSVIQMGGENGK